LQDREAPVNRTVDEITIGVIEAPAESTITFGVIEAPTNPRDWWAKVRAARRSEADRDGETPTIR
jgi:hypothetical protein